MTSDDCTSSIELFYFEKLNHESSNWGCCCLKSCSISILQKGVEASSQQVKTNISRSTSLQRRCYKSEALMIFWSRCHPIFTQIWRCKSTLVPGVNLWSFQTRSLPDWQSHWLSWADGSLFCANFRVACSNTLRQLKTQANNNPMFGPLAHSFYIFTKLTANSKPPPSLPSLSWHRKKEMSGQPNPTLGMGGCL